jgi:hypothetical protein
MGYYTPTSGFLQRGERIFLKCIAYSVSFIVFWRAAPPRSSFGLRQIFRYPHSCACTLLAVCQKIKKMLDKDYWGAYTLNSIVHLRRIYEN